MNAYGKAELSSYPTAKTGVVQMKRILRLALVMSVLCPAVLAQTVGSQISGTVRDSSGAVLPGVEVSVTNTDTAAARTIVTNETGSYVVPNLPVGPYRLEASLPGFSMYVQSGIVLQVNTNPTINVVLQVGQLSESIEVQADANMVETHSNVIGQVIDTQRVGELPLNGRNVAQLIALFGAAVPNTGGGLASNLNYPTVTAVSIAGGQNNATNYFLDGATHIDSRTNVGLPLPFPDALQEFKIETSTLPANYGSHPGGAINVVTKSGTNEFHGDAFWFVRNGSLNARNFFAPVRDSLKRNQYGGVLGGPIARDKLFFFQGYEGTIQRTAPATNIAYVPTGDVLAGNFQTILATPCQARQVNLPSSIANNNVLLPGLINPVALKVAALLPVSSDPCGKILYGVPSSSNEYQSVTRVDWHRTQEDSFFARYFITDYNLKAYYDKTNLLTAGTPGLLDRVQSVTLGDTYLLNSTTVNSFRFGFSRSAVQRVTADGTPTTAELGSNVWAPIKKYIGQFQVPGYFTINAIPGYVYNNLFNITEDMSMTRNKHQLAFGFNYVHAQMNALGPFQMNPRMTFNGQSAINGAATGNALAAFLTGRMDTLLQGGGQVGRENQNLPALYFQDNWKVSSRFQVNAGIRWDPFIPQQAKYGYASQFDPAKFYAGQVSQAFVNAPPGLTFPGDPGYPGNAATSARYWDFAPRFGIVYDPRGHGTETIRAGYGIFYDSSYLWNTMHIPLNPPWGYTITVNTPPGGFSNPWQGYPGGNPFPAPTVFPKDFQFPAGGTYVFEPPDAKATYLQQWNVSVQKQLETDWLVSATYLGNKTTHQWLGHELNPAVYIPGNCVAGQYGLTANGACSTTGNTNARRIFALAKPAGQYFGSAITVDTAGNASYNAVLLTLQHRMSHNFSVLANYTWSHCLNQGEAGQDIINYYQDSLNRRADWGNCVADRRQIANASLVLKAPQFRSSWFQRLAGDWQASGIYSFTSGSWLTIADGTDISLTGLGSDRPNVVADWHIANPTIKQWFNTSAFTRQPAGTFGNAGRGTILGPSSWNVDAALWRTFRIAESTKMDLRLEAFNVFNHARFNNPGTSLNNGNTLGQITSALDPRILQLALKLNF
jgi:Carboxypeptidase regulatory-like domain/TonB dependent receptor